MLTDLQTKPLARVLSLRHEFPTAFNQLLHRPINTPVSIELMDKHFPIFLKGRSLKIEEALLVLRTPPGQTVTGVRISVDDSNPQGQEEGFSEYEGLEGLWKRNIAIGELAGSDPRGEHTLEVTAGGELAPTEESGSSAAIDAEKLADIMLLLEYKVKVGA